VVDGGVADQDIDAAAGGAGQARGALPGVLLGHVALDRQGGRAVGAQLAGLVVDLACQVDEDQPGAFGSEPLGGGASDAGCGTGDDRGLAGEASGREGGCGRGHASRPVRWVMPLGRLPGRRSGWCGAGVTIRRRSRRHAARRDCATDAP
jgi:hypothetical protein